ncbi:hypothetical protein [uncultured Gammaproteobacteria bacterium]|nr:hypothetical protein [uncultured Gammaproteobacteria bacterium]SHN89678.1 hypothetical protein BCLUESOX_1890 [bacterium endosymbiont of Bathymodiolus sp. 5 South]CAC9656887.1 hypothetical protein [uncultured Gammaproteobacteria bacterium]CAC9657132.1 hypothetical protein [uncultured Gammaproteobacteria bacterium]SSC08650.1 hypothetical protein BTURTLESOX_1939 [bacterium endosymbiont of Bathymodiolus sp. 5 South]
MHFFDIFFVKHRYYQTLLNNTLHYQKNLKQLLYNLTPKKAGHP